MQVDWFRRITSTTTKQSLLRTLCKYIFLQSTLCWNLQL